MHILVVELLQIGEKKAIGEGGMTSKSLSKKWKSLGKRWRSGKAAGEKVLSCTRRGGEA